MSTILPYIYIAVGGSFFLYFIILWIYCGRIPAFGWFWPLMGSLSTGIGMLTLERRKITAHGIETAFWSDNFLMIRTFFLTIWPILILIILILFLAGAILLDRHGNKKPSPGADYVIILGAHVNGTLPSKALKSRIMAACQYLLNNPETKAILTGGQGSGEQITEALCMKQELLKQGISKERLLLEDKSTTTKENIAFASKIISQKHKKDVHIVVVTNDFHTLRGGYLAKTIGYHHVETLGASSSSIMKPHYYTREILSWIKLMTNRTGDFKWQHKHTTQTASQSSKDLKP